MKIFRIVLALTVMLGLTNAAHAYRINILDPYSVNQIFSQPFDVTLAPCQAGQYPSNFTPAANSGCFTGQNLTGSTITELQIVFPNQGAFANQTLQCDATSASIFTGSTCAYQNGQAVFTFSGLSIPERDSFLVYEEGVSTSNPQAPVPQGSAGFVNATNPVPTPNGLTPEPSSFVLLGTGLASAVAAGRKRFFPRG